MSHTNKHRTNHINSLSIEYVQEELGSQKSCPRRSCKGKCVAVIVRYYDHGPLNHEHECTLCGKVIKDPKFKEDREKYWKHKKQQNKR